MRNPTKKHTELATEFRYDPVQASHSSRDYQAECERRIAKAIAPDMPTLVHIATGGGKTFVANNFVFKKLNEEGFVLWVTKDWWLIQQAALDMAARHDGMASNLRRLGGQHYLSIENLKSVRRANWGNGVVYTTLQTLKRRLDNGMFKGVKPLLIVWDECHWGYAGRTGKALMEWTKRMRVPLLGLTGTPKNPEAFKVACRHTFKDLMDRGYLATPKFDKPIRTGVRWTPVRTINDGDFTAASLRELSQSEVRNGMIVEAYRAKASEYGKTLVFACNIEHANELTRLMVNEGIAVRPVHSGQSTEDNEEAIRQFSSASPEVHVLVNVVKMTTGVDIPDIKTLFLCRPTASDILFSQMVGRGARRTKVKHSFNIVEFTDIAERFEHVWSASRFLGVEIGQSYPKPQDSRPWPLSFDLQGAPTWTGEDVPAPAQNIWYRRGQSFGVEFELTRNDYDDIDADEWKIVAEELVSRLTRRLGSNRVRSEVKMVRGTPGYEKWKVEWDPSAGWEVVSRVLDGKEGLLELKEACDVLAEAVNDKNLGLEFNHRTGTHVHIGWLPNPKYVTKAVQLTHLLEPLLRSLVHPSRFALYDEEDKSYDTEQPNRFCRPVSDVYPIDDLDKETSLEDLKEVAARDREQCPRTVSFNPSPLWDLNSQSHVEVRLLNGTADAKELLTWLSLWFRILWAAEDKDWNLASDYDLTNPAELFPDLDMEDLLNVVDLTNESSTFLKRLKQRQAEIFDIWREHDELKEWLPPSNPQPIYQRQFLDVELALRSAGREPSSSRSFTGLDEEGKSCAIWCVLDGEGTLPLDDATVRKCAQRLRSEGWAKYERLRVDSMLYKQIRETLERTTRKGNGWLDIPKNSHRRAYTLVDEMGIDRWCDCLVISLSRKNGHVIRETVIRSTFKEAQERYGIEYSKLVQSIRKQIRSAINSCIRRGFIKREGPNHLQLLAEYREPD